MDTIIRGIVRRKVSKRTNLARKPTHNAITKGSAWPLGNALTKRFLTSPLGNNLSTNKRGCYFALFQS